MHRVSSLRAFSGWKILTLVVFVGTLLLGWATTGSTTWAQEPRPTLTPVPATTPTPAPDVAPAAEPFVFAGPILRGKVLNLTTGQLVSDVTVVFVTGDVSVEVVSDENGEYAFPHLGTANGVLNAVPPRGSGLKAVTRDVAVRTKAGVETVVNLAVSPSGNGTLPIIPTVELAPNSVRAGESFTITVLVKNTLSQAISDAVVTNWLPDRVVPVSIQSSTGNPYFSANLAVVELGHFDAGSGALVEIVAQATGGAATSALQGKVSFFCRECTAAQASASSASAPPTVLPVTGVGLPLIGLGLILLVFIVGWVRRRMGGASTAN